MKFIIHKTRRKHQPWHYTLVGDNGEVMLTSENFHYKNDVFDSIDTIQNNIINASIEDAPIKKVKK
jgi:uncharacterized protein YegP (UPF0339 family)